jgi:phosphate/sulfate permease
LAPCFAGAGVQKDVIGQIVIAWGATQPEAIVLSSG